MRTHYDYNLIISHSQNIHYFNDIIYFYFKPDVANWTPENVQEWLKQRKCVTEHCINKLLECRFPGSRLFDPELKDDLRKLELNIRDQNVLLEEVKHLKKQVDEAKKGLKTNIFYYYFNCSNTFISSF